MDETVRTKKLPYKKLSKKMVATFAETRGTAVSDIASTGGRASGLGMQGTDARVDAPIAC